jgi:hypothetical protein
MEKTDMKAFYRTVALGAFIGFFSIAPALAAPPTVVPSPGYDARLQEQRAALQAREQSRRLYQPAHPQRHRSHRGITH